MARTERTRKAEKDEPKRRGRAAAAEEKEEKSGRASGRRGRQKKEAKKPRYQSERIKLRELEEGEKLDVIRFGFGKNKYGIYAVYDCYDEQDNIISVFSSNESTAFKWIGVNTLNADGSVPLTLEVGTEEYNGEDYNVLLVTEYGDKKDYAKVDGEDEEDEDEDSEEDD